MKKLLLLLLLVPIFLFGQLKFLPSSNGEVVEHTYYSLSYLEEHEQAEWVHYRLDSIRASEDEIKTAVLIAADIMKMSTLFYGNEFDLEAFKKMLKGE